MSVNRNFDTFKGVATDIHAFLEEKFSMPLVVRSLNRAVNDLNLYSFSEVSFNSTIKQVSQSLMITLPDDCAKVTKVGIWANNGQSILILDRKNHSHTKKHYETQFTEAHPSVIVCPSCNPTTETMLTLPSATDTAYGSQCCDACTFYGSDCLPRYGIRQGYNGAYVYDNDNNRLLFEDVAADEYIVIEYQSTITERDRTLLPMYAFDVLRNKTATYLYMSEPRQAQAYEVMYRQYKQRMDNLNAKFNLDEIVNALTSPRGRQGSQYYY